MGKKQDTYPTQEQIDDFARWLALTERELEELIIDSPSFLDDLPETIKKWTVKDFISVIQDNL